MIPRNLILFMLLIPGNSIGDYRSKSETRLKDNTDPSRGFDTKINAHQHRQQQPRMYFVDVVQSCYNPVQNNDEQSIERGIRRRHQCTNSIASQPASKAAPPALPASSGGIVRDTGRRRRFHCNRRGLSEQALLLQPKTEAEAVNSPVANVINFSGAPCGVRDLRGYCDIIIRRLL